MDRKELNKSVVSIGFAVVMLVVTACSYHEDKRANNNGVGTGGGGLTMAQKATFKWINDNLLQPKCVGCHSKSSSSKANQYPFESYQDLMDCGFILSTDPDKSDFYDAMKAKRMPPRRPVGDDMMAPVAEWIKKGAPEN